VVGRAPVELRGPEPTGLVGAVFKVGAKPLQPFCQESRTPPAAKEVPIGLYDPAEADLEHFGNCCSAGFLGERLFCWVTTRRFPALHVHRPRLTAVAATATLHRHVPSPWCPVSGHHRGPHSPLALPPALFRTPLPKQSVHAPAGGNRPPPMAPAKHTHLTPGSRPHSGESMHRPRAPRAYTPTTWAPPTGAWTGWPTRRSRTSRPLP